MQNSWQPKNEENPTPYTDDTKLDVRTEDGRIVKNQVAGSLFWANITDYRVAIPRKERKKHAR